MNIFEKIINGIATLADQEEALKDPWNAYKFAHRVPGADIEKCQEVACKDPECAYKFAFRVKGADIKKCHESACKHPEWAYWFSLWIPESDIKLSLEACKGTMWESELNELLIERALR